MFCLRVLFYGRLVYRILVRSKTLGMVLRYRGMGEQGTCELLVSALSCDVCGSGWTV